MATRKKRIRRSVRSQTSQRGPSLGGATFTTNTRRRARRTNRAKATRISAAVQSQSNVSQWKGPRKIDITDTYGAAQKAVKGAVRTGAQKTRQNLARHSRRTGKNVSQAGLSYRQVAARGRKAFVRKLGYDIRW